MITFRCRLLLALVFVAVAALGRAATPSGSLELWYAKPAAKWTEALPVGGGRLGAMVFGGLAEERIQFNEDTLWAGKPHDYVRAGAKERVGELRDLLLAGRSAEAEKLARDSFIGDPKRQLPYQPFGDVRLRFTGHEAAVNYRRSLDLDGAVARTDYEVDGVRFSREVLASYPDNVIAVHLTASQAGRLGFELALTSPHPAATVTVVGDDGLTLAGRLAPDGLGYEARLRVSQQGGTRQVVDGKLVVADADEVTLTLVAATSFVTYEDISGDPAARCAAAQAKLAGRSYAALRATHQADHRELFRRVSLDLGRTATADLPTDERVRRVKTDGIAADPALVALHFNYGRYLLIACSRPGTQPANLQGLWNEELNPPWESKFTTNINFEMNYWPAELTGLGECHEAMFDLIDDVVKSGRRTATTQYGVRGWVLHHNTDLWRGTAPVNNIDGVWPTGGAWVSQHLWERYLFTGDKRFLAERAYPVMREAALFFVDTLAEDPTTKRLVVVPSYSPEQGNLTTGTTMDQQLVRALFDATIEAARTLGVDVEFSAQLAGLRARLLPNLVGKHGQLQEWKEDVDQPNNRHRHLSPLFAVYPGSGITPESPDEWAAAMKLLSWRGDGDTGWSLAWRIPLWARAGDGDFALRQLQLLLHRRTLPNLFDLCGPFQIDGNFGACAGVAELLLQSHRRADLAGGTRRHLIELLPALPKAWATGTVRGLRARGGFEIDLAWRDGALGRVEVRSEQGGICRLKSGTRTLDLVVPAGGHVVFNGALEPLAESKLSRNNSFDQVVAR